MYPPIKTYTDPLAPGVMPTSPDTWISNVAYSEVVQKMPIPCTDAIVTLSGDDRAVYLAKRSVLPMQGIWCLGGRIFFNDSSLEESVARCVQLETGCEFAPGRFIYLRTNMYAWVKTAQADCPGKNLAPLYRLEVSEQELERMAAGLRPAEYDAEFGLQRFTRERLVGEQVHDAMLDAYDQLFPS